MGFFKDSLALSVDIVMWALVLAVVFFGMKGCASSCDKASTKRFYWFPVLRCLVPFLIAALVFIASSGIVRVMFPLEQMIERW